MRAATSTVVDGPPFGVYEAGINTTEGGNNAGRCEMGIIHADGSYTVLARANTVAATPVQPIGRLRLEAVGNRIRFYVDGILNLEAFDSELHGHYVGLNCGITTFTGDGWYDNFATGLVVPPSGAIIERRDTVVGAGSILGSNRSGSGTIVEAHDIALSFTPHRPSSISGRKLLDQTGGVYLARSMSSWPASTSRACSTAATRRCAR